MRIWLLLKQVPGEDTVPIAWSDAGTRGNLDKLMAHALTLDEGVAYEWKQDGESTWWRWGGDYRKDFKWRIILVSSIDEG